MLKKMTLLSMLLVMVVVFGVSQSFAMRCGTRTVNLGDTATEVYTKCGPPDYKGQPWGALYLDGYKPGVRDGAVPVGAVINQWIYNGGSTRLQRVLRFRNGELIDIQTRGYGY